MLNNLSKRMVNSLFDIFVYDLQVAGKTVYREAKQNENA
jgi:hypothetical protein